MSSAPEDRQLARTLRYRSGGCVEWQSLFFASAYNQVRLRKPAAKSRVEREPRGCIADDADPLSSSGDVFIGVFKRRPSAAARPAVADRVTMTLLS